MWKQPGQESGRTLHVDTQFVHTVSGKAARGPCSSVQQLRKQVPWPSFSSVLTHFVPWRSLLESLHLQSEEVRLDAL